MPVQFYKTTNGRPLIKCYDFLTNIINDHYQKTYMVNSADKKSWEEKLKGQLRRYFVMSITITMSTMSITKSISPIFLYF